MNKKLAINLLVNSNSKINSIINCKVFALIPTENDFNYNSTQFYILSHLDQIFVKI